MSQQLPQFQTPNSYFLQPLHSGWHFTTVNNSATRRCTSAFRQYTSNLLSMPTSAALEAILDIFAVHKSKLTVSDFILTLLEDSKLQTHLCTLVLVKESSAIITALSRHSRSADSVFAWANGVVKKKYIESIKELTAMHLLKLSMTFASIPTLAKVPTFCLPRMFSGVTTIWMSSGRKSNGIQNVRVLPEPVAAIDATSLSFFKMACTTQKTLHLITNFAQEEHIRCP